MIKLKEYKSVGHSLTADIGKTLSIIYGKFDGGEFIKFQGEWRTDMYGVPYIRTNQIDETIEALQIIKRAITKEPTC